MKKYSQLIQVMPVDNHTVTTKKSIWEKYQTKSETFWEIIEILFNEESVLKLSRLEIKKIAYDADGKFHKLIIATILWGYASDMRGNNLIRIINQLDIINELLNDASNGIEDWSTHFSRVKTIKGLGLSTYTKLLYFIGATVNGLPALILDVRVIQAINTGMYPEFTSIQGFSYNNAPSKYPEYLSIVQAFSQNHHCSGEQVEMFLFSFGQNLKNN